MVDELVPYPGFDSPDAEPAVRLIRGLETVDLARYSVVGSYTRFDEAVRNALKDARQRIVGGLQHRGNRRENHLLWAAPGSGKTYLIQQIAESLGDRVQYHEVNLAKCDEGQFRAALGEFDQVTDPVLCLIDEADARPDASWPYEVLLPYLDAGPERGKSWVFVLAGSSGNSRAEMKRLMAARPKGADLLSRIPVENEYDIAGFDIGDRILVALSQLNLAAKERTQEIHSVEKLALLFVALTPYLGNARQLREFSLRSIERIPAGEDRLRYDNLFPAGDPTNKEFWSRVHSAAPDLENSFVTFLWTTPPQAPVSASDAKNPRLDERPRPADPAWRDALRAWPHTRTRLIGRQREIEDLRHLLLEEATPIVTLTGPGGIGKTRLALEVADLIGAELAEGARVVSLAPLSSPALVPTAIGQVLGIGESAEESVLERILDYLRERELLILLDNFEHVSEAASAVASILAASPRVRVLVTSRMPLRIYGEREFPVQPLPLPDALSRPALHQVQESAAVQLFVERAQAARPDFTLTDAYHEIVPSICRAVDGLPLAIELAAAHVKFFQPEALLSRLEHRLQLLTSGARDLPERQRTLRNTIEWSYNLLSPAEQTQLRRLSVFLGGFTLEAAEAVCGGVTDLAAAGSERPDFMKNLTALVDKSLLKQADSTSSDPRFLMLETIREFALETLSHSGESAVFSRRHAEYFAGLAKQGAPKLRSPEQQAWLKRLDADHDNLRAALTWSRAAANAGMGGTEVLIGLASSLCWFWYTQGYLSEGRAWLTESLARASNDADEATLEARAETLFGIGALSGRQSDFEMAITRLGESVAAWSHLDRPRGLAWALAMLGFSKVGHGDYDAGSRLMEESAQIFRSINDDWGLAYSMNPGGRARLLRGDFEGARSRWQEGLSLFKAMNDEWGLGMTLTNLLDLALHRDDLTGIQTLMDDASRACQESGDRFTFAFLHCMLGDLQRRQGNDSRALENYITCLTTMREIASNNTAARCTFGLGRIAASRNQPALSAQLLGASDHYGGVDSLVAVIRAERDQLETSLRRDLGQQAFDAAWQAGQGLQLAEVQGIAETLLGQELTADQGPAQGSPDHTTQGTLTRRELEVLELLRRGLTNRDIADALVISERTAEHHVTNILQKLNLRSRTQAATWAAEHSAATPSDTTT